MKIKRIKNLPVGDYVKCSFCKEKAANRQCVGHPHYGRTVCDICYQEMKEKENRKYDEHTSEGEEQAYSMYKVY